MNVVGPDVTDDPLAARRRLLRDLVTENVTGGFREVLRRMLAVDDFLDRHADALGPAGVDDLIAVFTAAPNDERN